MTKTRDRGLLFIFIVVVLLSIRCTENKVVLYPNAPSHSFTPSRQNIQKINRIFEAAERFYSAKKYDSATIYYNQVYKNVPQLINNSVGYFKIAYSYYTVDRPDSAIFWFKKCVADKNFALMDYACFFLADCYFQKNNVIAAKTLYNHVATLSANPFLINQSLFKVLKIEQKYDSHLLHKINEKYLENDREEYIAFKIKLLERQDKQHLLIDYLIRAARGDWHSALDSLIMNRLENLAGIMSFEKRIRLIRTFLNSGRNDRADIFIKKFNSDTTSTLKERTILTFYTALLNFNKRKYSTANSQFEAIKISYLPKKLKAERALYLARCQARLGFLNSAIKKYYAFQRKYPNHDKAGDALWWIALTFEQRNEFRNAEKYYQILANKFSKRQVGKEALLRIIFNHIKKKHYRTALRLINKAYKKLSYDDKLRMTYWRYRCFQLLGEKEEANEEKKKLLKDPFQNFFTIKTFLQEKHDSLSLFKNWGSYTPPSLINLAEQDIRYLERVNWVAELLNKRYARAELKRLLLLNKKNKNFRLFLAELNEKLGNWSDAFWLFRRNYESFFIRKNWQRKIGYIKKLYPMYYDSLVFKYAQQNSIDPFLVYGLIKRESLFQENVRSYANAYGLMQILPSTAKRLSKRLLHKKYRVPVDLFNPEINIELGTKYLGMLNDDFNGHLPYMIASYNAGENRVKKWEKRYNVKNDPDLFIELIPIDQTRKYVKFVLYYYYVYQWFYRNGSDIHWYDLEESKIR